MIEPVFNGVVPSPVDVRDYKLAVAMTAPFPDTFQVDILTPVKNQTSTPSCVAHATSTIVENHFQSETGTYAEFSTEFIYGYRPFGYHIGDGMCLRDACKTLADVGDVYEVDCKGNHNYKEAMLNVEKSIDELRSKAYPHRISKYVRLRNESDIMQALMNYGPVLISMKWYEKSKLDADGIYTYDPKNDYGYHAVVIYGWNESGWLVQNSWSVLWGKHGRFVLPFEFDICEAWAIIDNIQDNDDDYREPFKTKLGCLLAKFLNWLVNLFRGRKN